ncbi:MAG TPA: cytochrome c [Gammaproteobacteria bacterium]
MTVSAKKASAKKVSDTFSDEKWCLTPFPLEKRCLTPFLQAAFLPLLAACFACGAAAQDLVGDAERGAVRYSELRCYACHGHTGETGPAPRLNPTRFNQAGFIAYVRNPATFYRGNVGGAMPPYAADDVSDQDLADIYAYLDALPSTSPALEDIPLLDE